MEQKDFKMFTVFHCPICFDYKQTELECVHEYTLILFELNNGTRQLRRYCKHCHHRDGQIVSQKDCELSAIPVRQEISYKEFISKNNDYESDDRKRYVSSIRDKQEGLFYKRYSDYMSSDEWRNTRMPILERDSYKCRICGSNAEEVHHLTYAHFEKEFDFELVSLCKHCHYTEYHSKQAKDNLDDLNYPNK